MWIDGLQVGGGITESNAEEWLKAGAEKVSLEQTVLAKYGTDGFKLKRPRQLLRILPCRSS